ncbi:MAG: Holliday junction DNA helicase RuvB [Candidatus Harrisonbacteria bacterium RIFCSPLOWO2_02_FULL_41_13b]|uniref:Holliday junction branch migration complex subunit RuvB n=1 Tax=Candidatus Harrisonbacteria bacterium RIFCSPLOWO2_02_FULL_41_13b TaxID=1798409 RepID=A0A1G1ZSJ6_9BACT|nr:MAG: Holliday junction DNA helicase RuvB [Candidatus Harrisonbacteria bacterium RIFCSPLOWO2_02_FULL_41_13b]
MSNQGLSDKKNINTGQEDEKFLDLALRPTNFNDYIGQDKVKRNLSILISAASKRKDPLEHILIHGPSGLGKTTLAYIISRQMGSSLRITSGATLEKAGDLGSILTGLNEGDFLFIDEVHRLNKLVEETLYPAMENYKLDIIIGKGNSAKTLQIQLPKFTLIAATTKISLLSSPFRSRFGVSYKLDFYNQSDIEKILTRSAQLLSIKTEPEALKVIAAASRFTPRTANKLLKRARDYTQSENKEVLTASLASQTLDLLEIDHIGLEATDKKILSSIAKNFNGGPVGLKTIAALIAEDENTIEDVYEPYLMQIGFLARTTRGRVITQEGAKHIGIKLSKDMQSTLV